MPRQINVAKLVMCLIGDLTKRLAQIEEFSWIAFPERGGGEGGGGGRALRVCLSSAPANLSVGGGAPARSEKVNRSWKQALFDPVV